MQLPSVVTQLDEAQPAGISFTALLPGIGDIDVAAAVNRHVLVIAEATAQRSDRVAERCCLRPTRRSLSWHSQQK